MGKPILCLDFDGVLHSYGSGWLGSAEIPDPPVPGAMEFLQTAVPLFAVAILSSRSSSPEGLAAMKSWTLYNLRVDLGEEAGDAVFVQLEWPTSKPAAFLTIDDRTVQFQGLWPDVEELLRFKPWNKRARDEVVADPVITALQEKLEEAVDALVLVRAELSNHDQAIEVSANHALEAVAQVLGP